MAYLHLSDYKTFIQTAYFSQLVQGDDTKRVQQERLSLSLIKGKLQQKYDVSQEFTDTAAWSPATTYAARSRVIIDFPVWVTSTAYTSGVSVVIYQGNGYICLTTNTDATFTLAKWTLIAAQNTIYYAAYPSTCTYPATLSEPNAPVFNYKKAYRQNDVVFWKGNTWVCNTSTTNILPCNLINFYDYDKIPFYNVFPDDVVNNGNYQYWKLPTAYVVTAGTPLSNSAWVQGDNREQQIVFAMKAITIYELAPLLAPQNVPKNWEVKRNEAMYLIGEMFGGQQTVDIPLLQPSKGKRIRSGGQIKLQNRY